MIKLLVGVFLWFLFSITLTAFNKYFFQTTSTSNSTPSFHNSTSPLNSTLSNNITLTYNNSSDITNTKSSFHIFPLLTTSFHTFVHFVITSVYFFPSFPSYEPKFWLILTSFATALDLGLSNFSLKFVHLSTYEVLKSMSPVFVYLISKLLQLKTTGKFLPVVGVVIGVLLTVSPKLQQSNNNLNDQLELLGIFLVLIASFMSGIRWTFMQKILSIEKESEETISVPINGEETNNNNEPTKSKSKWFQLIEKYFWKGRDYEKLEMESMHQHASPPDSPNLNDNKIEEAKEVESQDNEKRKNKKLKLLFQTSLVTSLLLFICSLLIEHPFSASLVSQNSTRFTTPSLSILLSLMILSALLAFLMIWSELFVLHLVGAVGLSLLGMLKECLMIVVAAVLFGDSFGWWSGAGVLITILSLGWYHLSQH